MSWSNPSQKEAEEAYYSNKKRYNSAATEKRNSERQENEYISQKCSYDKQLWSLNSQRINIEKRIQQIGLIIAMLKTSTSNNGLMSWILQTNKELNKTEESFLKSIIMADYDPSFKRLEISSVDKDPNSNHALELLENEKKRLEQALADIKSQMNNARAQINELIRKINQCNSYQQTLSSTMMSSVYEMNHYKKYM